MDFKGHTQESKNTTHRMGENICKGNHQQGINLQNIQTAHAAQLRKKKSKTGQET